MFPQTPNLLLLTSALLTAITAYPSLDIQRDTGNTGTGLENTYVYSSVAVYDPSVSTTTFTPAQLYALAQLAWEEMLVYLWQPNGGPSIVGQSKRPNTVAAMAVGNLVYFSSSMKSKNYILEVAPNAAISGALQRCQAGLQMNAQPGVQMAALHKNRATCGEVGCLLYQNRDRADREGNFNWDQRVIVAYGGKDPQSGMMMACCGSPGLPGSDATSWGCYEFMAAQGVVAPDVTTEPLELPEAEPTAIRHLNLC